MVLLKKLLSGQASLIAWVALLSFVFVTADYAQVRIPLSVDVAEFQDANRNPYLEIYYAVPENAIRYVPSEQGGFESRLVMDMLVYKGDSLWATKLWKVERNRPDTTQVQENKQMVDMFRYLLGEPGKYRVVMHVRDLNREDVVDSVDTEIICHKFSEKELELSDVQLATKIQRTSANGASIFTKKNYEVVPNPTLIFGQTTPMLYYYYEAYNVRKNVPGSIYKCMAFLKDASGKVVEGLGSPSRKKKKRFDNTVEIGLINISRVPSGQYYLVYGVSDSSGTLIKTKEKKFFIYNPEVPGVAMASAGGGVAVSSGSLGDLDTMTGEELDREFQRMRYITSKEDRNFYKNLTNLQAKREFIFSIWKAVQNAEGLTPMQYRRVYLDRIKAANARYRESGKEGWETDRGRVYVLYGPPTNVERFPSSPQNKPYQIWTYDYLRGQGGIIFVFADRFGFNKYELLHSTLRGELQDPFWQRYILIGPQQSLQQGAIQN